MANALRPLLSSLFIVVGPAAEAQSIQSMMAECRQGSTYCVGYMEGVQTLMQANCQLGGLEELSIGWFPSMEGGISAFLLWAANNSDKRDWPFFHGVVSAFNEAFPCDSVR